MSSSRFKLISTFFKEHKKFCTTEKAKTYQPGEKLYAIEKYFTGKSYWSAGFDLSPKTLQLIQNGHIRCTVDQQPYIQGFYPVIQLTHYLRYGIIPSDIDAGATIIDESNVDQVITLTKQQYR